MAEAERPNRRSADPRVQSLDTRVSILDRDLAETQRDFNEIRSDIREVKAKIDAVYNAISEPQQSPLGRALLDRANTNAANNERNSVRITNLEAWQSEIRGGVKSMNAIQRVLAVIVAILGIINAVIVIVLNNRPN